jgi:hypothetical protein
MSPTLILSPRHTPDSAALWRAALDAGWKTERLGSYNLPDWLQNQEIAIYGEGLFCGIIAERLGKVLIEPTMDWLVALPTDYLRRKVMFTQVGEARKITQPTFIKPAVGKLFKATVYRSGADLPDPDIQPDDTPALIAEPVVWGIEYRCFVLDRVVKTFSSYWKDGDITENDAGEWVSSTEDDEAMLAFCQHLLNDPAVQVPPAFVLDVGYIDGRGWAVLEANPAWASGIYGADPAEVLPILARSCVDRSTLAEEDSQWVIEYVD